ncbi:flavin reductase family protein [Methylobrevis albus]|uniref:Flavin reductase family protein n=1 Tax=Methylobrevis albus TaxID=2793297 RepID=A0A931MZE0_9HYPH|nr:flavin reductase family protein [Methylobrevis albus]MBH0238930.1 flavin reductase family protein [Methylobrevis albus]
MNVALNQHPAAAAGTPPAGLHDLDPAALKIAMRSLAGGVSVITAGSGDDRTGATVTSATSLSVEPPTMIVNINLASSSWPVIRRHGHFCVNIVRHDQQPIADRFAGRGGLKGVARYEGADWTTLITGAPVLIGALAAIDCEVEEAIERHSHAIILGRVRAIAHGSGDPLVYANARYGTFLP